MLDRSWSACRARLGLEEGEDVGLVVDQGEFVGWDCNDGTRDDGSSTPRDASVAIARKESLSSPKPGEDRKALRVCRFVGRRVQRMRW